MNNQEVVNKYFNKPTFKNYREDTQKTYRRTLLKLIDLLESKGLLLTELKEEHLGIYPDFLEEKRYESSTYNKMMSPYKNLIEFIYVENLNRKFDLPAFNARFKSMKIEDKTERGSDAIVSGDFMKLMDYVYDMDGYNVDSQKNKVLTLIILSTGLRRTEASLLRKEDINLETMMVNPSFTKGGHKRKMLLPLKESLINEIKKLYAFYDKVGIKGDYVIMTKTGKPIDKSCVNVILNGKRGILTKALNLNIVPIKITTHGLRKSIATYLSDLGVKVEVIAMLLGHESVETTKGYYIKVDTEEGENAVRDALGGF